MFGPTPPIQPQAIHPAQHVADYPWNGDQYNGPLGPQFTHGLTLVLRWANAVSHYHPGLYFARYDDIPSVQLDLRPSQAPLPAFDLNALLAADQEDPTQ